jgi:hypothetical protein
MYADRKAEYIPFGQRLAVEVDAGVLLFSRLIIGNNDTRADAKEYSSQEDHANECHLR